MAKKKKADTQTDDGTLERWYEILEAHGQGSRGITIWRKLPNGKQQWLANVQVHEMDEPEELLADRFGGGTYVAVLRDENSRYMKGTRAEFDIAGPPKKLEPDDDEREEAIDELRDRIEELGRRKGDESSALILVELIRQQGELMRDLRNPPAGANQVNPLELTTTLITNVAQTFGPLVERFLDSREREPDTMSRLEELTVLMELAGKMGGKEPSDGFGVLAKTLGEPIAKLVEARTEGPQPNPPGGARPSTTTPGNDMANRPKWYPFLNPIMPSALRWAQGGKDPQLRGEFILDELTDEQLGPVYEILTSDTFLEEFYATYPDARAHQEWFGIVFRTIVAGIVPPDEQEADDGHQAEPAGAPSSEPPSSAERGAVEVGTSAPAAPSSSSSDTDDVAPGELEPRFRSS